MRADPTTPCIPTHSNAKSVLVLSCHQPTPGSSHMYYPGFGPPPSWLDTSQRRSSYTLAWHNNLRPKITQCDWNKAQRLSQNRPSWRRLVNIISWTRTKVEGRHECRFTLKYNAKIHFHIHHCIHQPHVAFHKKAWINDWKRIQLKWCLSHCGIISTWLTFSVMVEANAKWMLWQSALNVQIIIHPFAFMHCRQRRTHSVPFY